MIEQNHARTPAFRREVADHARAHGTVAAVERYGVPLSTVKAWRVKWSDAGNQARAAAHEHRHDAGGDLSADAAFLHQHPEFTDKRMAALDLWGALDAIETMQGVVGESSPGQHEAHVAILADAPIILLPTGDWHLGSYASDHAAFRAYLKLVLDTPHCYIMLLGDEVDNFPANFKSASAIFGQVVPPKIQHRILSKVLQELVAKGKIVARTWGNHNLFSETGVGGADYDYDHILPYLKTMGKLFLTVGGIEYKVFASHTFPGKSYLHVGHQNKRAIRFQWPDADLVLSGHTHSGPEHEVFLHDGRPRVSAMVGTYKTDDSYSKRYFGQSQVSDQAIVLHHDQHRMVPFANVEDAITYREGWKARRKPAA